MPARAAYASGDIVQNVACSSAEDVEHEVGTMMRASEVRAGEGCETAKSCVHLGAPLNRVHTTFGAFRCTL